MNKYYYVVRSYSWTDKNRLWKVLSRRIKDGAQAETEREFHARCFPKHEVFLVIKWEEV